jgi:hypothetical protein
MSEQPKKNYVPIAVAVFIGVMVGALMSSGDDKAERALAKRIAALETELAAKAPVAEAAPAAAAAPVAEAAPVVAALSEEEAARLAALEAKAAELAAATATTEALGDRVTVLGQQMAQIVAAIQSGGAAPAATPAAPAADPAPAAAPAEASADAGAALAAKIGETGLVLSVGQTGAAGDVRLFLSRVDAEANLVRVLVVGAGPQDVGSDAVTLANGCAVSLAGVVERKAYIAVDCPK